MHRKYLPFVFYHKEVSMSYYLTLLILAISLNSVAVSNLPPDLDERIVQLVRNNPQQMNVAQYSYLAKLILDHPGCNILIFGVGNDSSLYMDLNASGKVVFFEDNPFWITQMEQKYPGIEIYKVSYNTKRSQWKELLKQENRNLLNLDIPSFIRSTKWDIIFVDAPAGGNDQAPGRMKSLYTAAQLAHYHRDVHVLAHDTNRIVERQYCKTFLGDDNVVKTIGTLSHYFIK